jgi:hypothetical protein
LRQIAPQVAKLDLLYPLSVRQLSPFAVNLTHRSFCPQRKINANWRRDVVHRTDAIFLMRRLYVLRAALFS